MSERIWIWFADNGNIRKWSAEPFPEGTEYVARTGLLDPYTIERCAAAIAVANRNLPGISTERMRGDNLAIILCSVFDDGDAETEDETGWSAAAGEGYEEAIAAIREHFAAAIRALGKGEG